MGKKHWNAIITLQNEDGTYDTEFSKNRWKTKSYVNLEQLVRLNCPKGFTRKVKCEAWDTERSDVPSPPFFYHRDGKNYNFSPTPDQNKLPVMSQTA